MPKDSFVDFQGKVVLVSGASSGIGNATAAMLGRQGAKLILVGRDLTKLKRTAENLQVSEYRILKLDLTKSETIVPAVEKVSREFGLIYGLCHAAGVAQTLPLRSTKPEQIRAILDVNLLAGIELAKAVTRRGIMEPEGGSILFLSSIYGIIGKPGVVGYSASKGAIAAAARSMAVELAKRNIRVNVLSPGLVWTDMTQDAFSILPDENLKQIEADHLLRTGMPEDVARAAVFLLAPQNSWITGTNLVIDGGYTVK